MIRNRSLLVVLALVALPLMSAAAQGNSQSCNAEQARTVARMRANGEPVPAGLAKKCPPPPPPVADQPPTGPHYAFGVVYEDIDGNGARDMFSGEMGLGGWSVTLSWNNKVIATALTSVDDGSYSFGSLGNATYTVCVVSQSPYVLTAPASGACYTFSVNGTIQTGNPVPDFGMMLPPQ